MLTTTTEPVDYLCELVAVDVLKDGRDRSSVAPQFLLWMLADPTHGAITRAQRDDTKRFVSTVIALFENRATDAETLNAWKVWDTIDKGNRSLADMRSARCAWAAWTFYTTHDPEAAGATWDAWKKDERNTIAAEKLTELLTAVPSARSASW